MNNNSEKLKSFIKEFCIANKLLNKNDIKTKLYEYYPNLKIQLINSEKTNITKKYKEKKAS